MFFDDNIVTNTNLLDRHGLLDDVYKALSAMDTSAAVLATLDGMRKVGSLLIIPRSEKNSEKSYKYRTEGNGYYTSESYINALVCYNVALQCAPLHSTDLLLAYSNRSQLLLKLKAYTAAFNDIETCIKLKCEGDLLKKINTRRDECLKMMREEKLGYEVLKGFPEDFLKFNQKTHPEIPCLSADVDIVSVSGEKKVVAAKDIAVGSVIALETAFTTYSGNNKTLSTCYYCQKMSLNLIPCDDCCFVLFCDTVCRNNCMIDYHEIECKIMDVLHLLNVGHRFRLTIKTVLKLKSKCKRWSKLIEESNNIGANRLRTSSVGQVYDVKQYSSILCFKEDRHFAHGRLYNSCFAYATVLHYLEKIPGFFPESPIESLEAKKCFAKLCMTLDTMCPFITEIYDAVEKVSLRQLLLLHNMPSHCHFGWFSFTGKLKHSCDPNVIILGLNNRVALVAVQPIKKMSEITVSYVGHFYDQSYEEKSRRATKLYQSTLNVCNCQVCKDSWGINLYDTSMNPMQREAYLAWEFMKNTQAFQLQGHNLMFHVTCTALKELRDLVNTKEHLAVYMDFRKQLSLCQIAVTRNAMI